MGRLYDTKTGRRFDMLHPIWIEHNKTKAGVVSKRLMKTKIKELTDKGLIKVVPSVTDIASVAGGFGVFNYASKWGRDKTVEAFVKLRGEDEDFGKDKLTAEAIAIMNKPRDTGSELHEVFDKIRRGEMTYDQATDDQKAFYDKCLEVLSRLGIHEYETEVQFATDEYGGTCDLTMAKRGLDWKTVEKFRKPRERELLQMGAYGHHFGWEQSDTVYYHQTEHTVDIHHMDADALRNAYECFRSALELHKRIATLEI